MVDNARPVIGFIGLGFMGQGMAANLVRKGYPLWVRGNRNRAPVEALLALGAQEAASPADMAARCDIIHLCLPDSPQVEAVIHGPDGILAGGRKGLIVIDATTADPGSTERLAAELAAKGMHFVDAPLGRTPVEAAAGTLDAMVGASPEVFEKLRPVIGTWAANIQHMGPVGSAHRMKLVMNFIGMGYAALYSEALVLAVKSGLSPQDVQRVIGGSRLSNGFFETFMRYAVDRDANAHKFTIQNAAKDLRHVAAMAAAGGVVNPMGAAIRNAFAQAEAVGKGSDYVPSLSDHIASENGIDLPAAVEKGKT
ncbi:MAG: NAD(P)-dependent oxidoreductase [Paracoccaceae bacterium]|nr:NAD(P)-dependent oxidoreductase [Paracoccaceae bacterium]